MTFVSNLINGISLGSVYAIIALGYTMVYGIAKMLNFAHGDVIMIGGYASFITMMSMSSGLNIAGLEEGSPELIGMRILIGVAAALVAIVICTLLGILIERLAYKPLRQASNLAVLITAIGVSYFLQNIALLIFGSNPKSYTPITKGFESVSLFGGQLTVTTISILTIVACIVIMITLTLFTKKSKTGKAMRAVSEDRDAASLMGINVNRTISITFAIGSALAAIAGILYCSAYPTLMPTTGAMPGIKAFTAAVFGGIGSIPGAMLGGFLLGIIEIFAKSYISTELSDAIVFAVLIIVLLVKPTGLLGKKLSEKV